AIAPSDLRVTQPRRPQATMAPMRRRPPLGPPSHHLPLALMFGPAMFGALLGWVSERSFLSAFLLLGEPILLAVAVYALAILVVHKRLVSAAFLLSCGA